MNLKTKFSLGIATVVTLSIVAVSGVTLYSQQKLLKSEIKENHRQLADRLARVCEESLYQSNLVFLNYVETLQKERGFLAACFVDETGNVQIHSNPKLQDEPLIVPVENGSPVLSYASPVNFGGKKVGEAWLYISPQAVNNFLASSMKNDVRRIGLIALIVLVISIFMAILLAGTLVAPIEQVVSGMNELSHGRHTPIPFKARHDELGWMGEEINRTIHKLNELNEMKRDFVNGITHDLKSPLKGMQGLLTMLSEGLDNLPMEKQREYLVTIQNNSDRLMKLIDDLLTTARIETGHHELNCRLYDVRKSAQEVAGLYQAIAREKKIAFKTDCPAQPVYVFAEEGKVVQILTNLVSNAFKFTPNGSITVRAWDDGKQAHVAVTDSGSGIPPADQEKIFEKFYRSGVNARDTKGTGLGLFIVKGLVEAQKGTINLTSEVGKGTTFTVSLPREE